MKLIFFTVTLTFVQCRFSINFQNNECSRILDYHIAPFSSHCRYNPDVLSDVPSVVKNNGYLVETHILTTPSGYILNVYRLSSQRTNPTGYPIMLLQGIATETGIWTSIGNRSLAFNLVDAGYDVWLASLRGTADSSTHTTWNINNPEYWTFSLDDLVNEDVDVQLTHIYLVSKEKVLIIGHSMATTLSFMYVSEYVEKSNQMVKGVVALAPVVYITGTLAFKYIDLGGLLVTNVLDWLDIRGLLYRAKFLHSSLVTVCKILPEFCYFLLSRVSGETEQFLPNDLLLFFSYWPSGLSVRELKHYFQISRSSIFRKYDFGTESENQQHYNTSEPPLYNLSKVQVPVYGYYGRHDVFYKEENMIRLYNELGTNRKCLTSTPINVSENLEFSHLDFVSSRNLIEYLHVPLLETLKTFFN